MTDPVHQRIEQQLADHAILIYMKGTPDFPQCGFSAQAVAALKQVDADFSYINIFEEPDVRESLKSYSNWPTYPQLYINGELMGGCDIVLEMFKSGELKTLVDEAMGR